MAGSKRAKRLKPTGHSAVIESMIQPAIVIGSTLMSAIAAYVLALDEITRILARRGTPADVFIVALCAGMGFLIDMAIIVSATRYKMHAVRADPREVRWLQLAKWVLAVGLASETLTLFYFFVHLSARAFPGTFVQVADWIHSVLAILRAFLPPIVIAYFAAGVLPVMFDRADRNREIKSRTSSNIMLLIDRLSEVFDTDDKAEMLRALGGQLMLDTYATYDETARTSEDDQLKRDGKLLTHLARIHRLDWSPIAAEIAPELGNQLHVELPVTPSVISPVTQVLQHPADARFNTLAAADAESDADGDEPPENDPSPPGGKRRPSAGGNGDDAMRWNVGTQPSNTQGAAARITPPATPATPAKRTRKPPTKPTPKQEPKRVNAGRSQSETEDLREARMAAARTILAQDPDISIRPFTRRIAMITHVPIDLHTAYTILVELTGRKPKSKTAEAAERAKAATASE